MGIFSRFEDKMEDTVDAAASRISKAPISPVQIAKKAERQMRRETMVGAGKEYAPTLYTVLVNPDDDARLFGYYPTLAGETETYLKAKAAQEGLVMDGNPLVRFIVDEGLRHGKFDVIAETVAAPIIAQLRDEEMERYGILQRPSNQGRNHQVPAPANQGHQNYAPPSRQASQQEPPSYVPGNSAGRAPDYGEYSFNDQGYDAENGEYGGYDEYGQNSGYDAYNSPDTYGAPNAPNTYDAYDNQPPRSHRHNSMTGDPGQRRAAANQRPQDDFPSAGKARLFDHRQRRSYNLTNNVMTLGRDSTNDISVNDVNASRRHAELSLTPQGIWVLTDLNSTNGTQLNGTTIESQPLYPGDIITIGKTEFEFITD